MPSEAADALNRIAEGIRARSLSLSMGEDASRCAEAP